MSSTFSFEGLRSTTMTHIVVAPELEISKVVRRGIVTVPEEMAKVSCDCLLRKPCSGLVTFPLEARELELHMRGMADKFISRMAVRGFESIGGLGLHGPWPSYEFNERLADIEAEAWKRAEREQDRSYLVPFVFERDATSPYKDYLLVGEFLKENVLTEVIVKEG